MSADVLLIFNGRGISFLVAVHTNTVKLGGQTNDALNYLQVVIEDEASVLKDQDLEQGLNTRVANIRSLTLNHGIHHIRYPCRSA